MHEVTRFKKWHVTVRTGTPRAGLGHAARPRPRSGSTAARRRHAGSPIT